MPRYFFHLHDGQDLPDHEGQVLPDLKAAQSHAAEIVCLQLQEDTAAQVKGELWTLEVKDDEQRLLFTLKFEALAPSSD